MYLIFLCSIFAGIAVIANYLLMMTWFPAGLVILEKSCFSHSNFCRSLWICYQQCCCLLFPWSFSCTCLRVMKTIWIKKEKWLLDTVLRLRYVWFILLLVIALGSGCVVLIYPKLQLPDSTDFQLFSSSHPFEQYDFIYRNRFWFNKPERVSTAFLIN